MAIIDFKADWPALVEIAGFRTWSHNINPCPLCLVKKKDLDSVAGFCANSCPFPLYDTAKYEAKELLYVFL